MPQNWIVVLALGTVVLISTHAAQAQSIDYSRGYSDGYTGRVPAAGALGQSSDYTRGFQSGQDDAEDDGRQDQRRLQEFERSFNQPAGGAPPAGKDDE